MGKNFKSKKEKKSDFKSFLKKRAPIYLGIMVFFLIFLIPELTQSNLQTSLPNNFTEEEKQALDILMSYDGDNDKGLTIIDALAEQIETEYPNEKIYDNNDTTIDLFVSSIDETKNEYEVSFIFESYNGLHEYLWNINVDTGEIKAVNSEAKGIVGIVDYFD